jgi:chemotaxis protein CheD
VFGISSLLVYFMVVNNAHSEKTPNIRPVGISDMVVSSDPTDILITYSLGSCIGVTMYDPGRCLGALIHCMLPLAKLSPSREKEKPYMFVDVGVPKMLDTLLEMGARKSQLIVKVAGAGVFLDQNRIFNIGERNYTVLRKVLWKNRLLIAAEDVGGTTPRTMVLYMRNGMTTIKTAGREAELI